TRGEVEDALERKNIGAYDPQARKYSRLTRVGSTFLILGVLLIIGTMFHIGIFNVTHNIPYFSLKFHTITGITMYSLGAVMTIGGLNTLIIGCVKSYNHKKEQLNRQQVTTILRDLKEDLAEARQNYENSRLIQRVRQLENAIQV